MRIKLLISLLSSLFLTLSACSHYPMGMDEKTWKALPPDKKAELLKEEAKLKHERQLAALRAQEAEARARAEAEKARLAALQALYRRLDYGELLQVSFSGGEGYFYRYKPILPNTIMLPIGTIQRIRLQSTAGDNLELWTGYSPGKLVLCSEKPDGLDRIDPRACTVVVDHRWEHGERYRITVPRPWNKKRPLLRNVHLYVKYPPLERRHTCR